MTLLIDAAPLVAPGDPAEPRREEILETLGGERGVLVIPAPTTAEIDYLLGQRFGQAARRAFLADLAAGRFTVAGLDVGDYDDRWARSPLRKPRSGTRGLRARRSRRQIANRPDPRVRRASLQDRSAADRSAVHAATKRTRESRRDKGAVKDGLARRPVGRRCATARRMSRSRRHRSPLRWPARSRPAG